MKTTRADGRRWRPSRWVWGALLVLVAVSSGCGSSVSGAGSDDATEAHGKVLVELDGLSYDENFAWFSELPPTERDRYGADTGPCPTPLPAPFDNALGGQVELLDASSEVVALGDLADEGEWDRLDGRCTIEFTVDVPNGDFFTLRVGEANETFDRSSLLSEDLALVWSVGS